MQLASCPNCGTEIGLDDIDSDQVKLALATGALLGASAVVGMLVELPDYLGAREGFEERLREITEEIHKTADHMTEWGSAYDE